jgi:hypothetical protein
MFHRSRVSRTPAPRPSSKLGRALALLALLGLAIMGSPSPVAQSAPEGAPLRRLPPRVLPSTPAASPRLQAVPAPYGQCVEIVAQRWQEDNWEIYAFRGDGSDLRRLTQNTVWDGAPSMGATCDLIVFESDRDGPIELYAMDRTGGDLQRLTFSSVDNYWPALSPDGAHVAFRRDAEEQAEIYTLRRSDGAITRLTHNSHYDDRPAWSPDAQIVFVSDPSNAYLDYLWIMNADGSDARELLSGPVASAPQWSPTGERIAFAAYPDGSSFAELWVVNADGSDARQVFKSTNPTTGAIPGGWTPDGRYILYEEAEWVQIDGEWFISESSIYMLNPDNVAERYLASPDGVYMAPAVALCDKNPPTSSVNTLPATSSMPFLVTWAGEDACSPTIEFQIQYRRGPAGSWQDWPVSPGQPWTTETQAHFGLAAAGETVFFRSRARDQAGNVEPWPPEDGDTYTTIVTVGPTHTPAVTPSPTPTLAVTPSPTPTVSPDVAFAGAVRDVRGVPIAGALVRGVAPPAPDAEAHTGAGGGYSFQIHKGAFAVQASATGYMPTSLQRPHPAAVAGATLYLSATPELLTNGGFESGRAGWYSRGIVDTVTTSWSHGARVARLGQPLAGAALRSALFDAWPSYGLWQQLTIPSAMENPTLSWVYALPGEAPAGMLQVLIGPVGAPVAVWSASRPTAWGTLPGGEGYPAWQHAHLDLSPWRDQTVQIEFAYTPGGAGRYALLDAVSVSPWLTPRVDGVAPSALAVGQAATLNIYGANLEADAQVFLGNLALVAQRIDGGRMQATFEGDLPSGRYDLFVENPSGRRSGLPQAVRIGGHVALPLISRR